MRLVSFYRLSSLMAGVLAFTACEQQQKTDAMMLEYPTTQKGTQIDQYHGEDVADPYRWLEDDLSEETAAWVTAQNKVTYNYLDQIPYRDSIKEQLTTLWNYEKVGAPFDEGDYTYFYKNDGLQNQSILYRHPLGKEAETEVFLDPNQLSEDGTTSLSMVSFSKDGSLAAYSISEGGSDWRTIIVLDTATKKQVGDAVENAKFSGIAWYKNEGFYYSSYDQPEGSELSAKTDQHKLYYHRLGTTQDQDRVVYGGTEAQKHRYVGAGVSDDQAFLYITASTSTNGNKLFVQEISSGKMTVVQDNDDSNTYPIHNEGKTLWLQTDYKAPNKRIVTTSLEAAPKDWKDLIPMTENVLSASTAGGYIMASYMVDAITKIKQFDMQGELVREISLPGIGTASGFSAKQKDTSLYYRFTNYITPSSIYQLDIKEGTSEVYRQPKIDFDSSQYESKQVFYTSKDGTRVPMIISHKKGLVLDGSHPAILYGYGGFNVSLNPGFSVSRAAWMQMGGVYAVANLRGGGEYGKAWHDAGTKLQKQNVFDDFIAAAAYLKDNKYTQTDKLAIQGGSNGGLLVGAVMTQQPDICAVALPAVGVLDMLRYHTFTSGAGWKYDYGTSTESKEMFDYLKGYSPVHNVQEGISYPATLITTADHDDRVVPAHSFKFAAELQDKHEGANPVCIRIGVNAGHGAGKSTEQQINEITDIYSFSLYNMGVTNLP